MEPSANLSTVLTISLPFVTILSVVFVSRVSNPQKEFRLKVQDDLDTKFAEYVEGLAEKTIEVASYEANDDGEIEVDNSIAVTKVIRGEFDSSYLDINSLGQGIENNVAEEQRKVRRSLPAVRWADRCYALCYRSYWLTVRLSVLIVIAFLIGLFGIAFPVVYDGPLPDWVGRPLSEQAVLAGLIGLGVAVLTGLIFF
jgi:hypothetical protein